MQIFGFLLLLPRESRDKSAAFQRFALELVAARRYLYRLPINLSLFRVRSHVHELQPNIS